MSREVRPDFFYGRPLCTLTLSHPFCTVYIKILKKTFANKKTTYTNSIKQPVSEILKDGHLFLHKLNQPLQLILL